MRRLRQSRQKHVFALAKDTAKIDGLARRAFPAREGPYLGDQLLASFACHLDAAGKLTFVRPVAQILLEESGKPQYGAEDVVEVMGDAAGQLTQCFQSA